MADKMIPNAPGIYPGLPMADYLEIDALSATPVQTLIDECPRAGWWCSRLNPKRKRERAAVMDIGSAAHSVFLEDSWACVVEIDPANYRAKSKPHAIPKGFTNDDIKAARDAVYEQGKYPVLLGAFGPIRDMVHEAREFVASLKETEPAVWAAFQPGGGESEVTMLWDEGGILCKLRVDRISADNGIVVDYKTSGMSVQPDRYGRTAIYGGLGYAFGAAWYRRGIQALTGKLPTYLWLAQETAPPHICSLPGATPEGLALAEEKVAVGLKKWGECLLYGIWPGYANRVCYPELPAYERARWDERLIVGNDGIDYGSQA